MAYQIDSTQQNVIVARLTDFCQWSNLVSDYENNAWDYMRRKLLELQAPVLKLKQDQLMAAADAFVAQLKVRQPDEADIVEFKTAIHSYLSASDFIDISFNLTPEALANPAQKETVLDMIRSMRSVSLFQGDEAPESRCSPQTRQLIAELHHRLGLDTLDKILSRKPRTARRRRMILRRVRRNVAEFCSVLHLSFGSNDTFSPFMLLRVEALLVTCLRFLNKFRS